MSRCKNKKTRTFEYIETKILNNKSIVHIILTMLNVSKTFKQKHLRIQFCIELQSLRKIEREIKINVPKLNYPFITR